jgi:hypothetical protein
MTAAKPHPALVQQLHGKRRWITEEAGLDRVRALQAAPSELHRLPAGQQSQHSRSRSCPCNPTVEKTSWWQWAVTHQVIGPESGDDLSLQDWRDRHEAERRRPR